MSLAACGAGGAGTGVGAGGGVGVGVGIWAMAGVAAPIPISSPATTMLRLTRSISPKSSWPSTGRSASTRAVLPATTSKTIHHANVNVTPNDSALLSACRPIDGSSEPVHQRSSAKPKPSANSTSTVVSGPPVRCTRPKMAPLSAAPAISPIRSANTRNISPRKKSSSQIGASTHTSRPNDDQHERAALGLELLHEVLLLGLAEDQHHEQLEDPPAGHHHRARRHGRPERRAAQPEPARAHLAVVDLHGQQREDDQQHVLDERGAERDALGRVVDRGRAAAHRQDRERDRAAEERGQHGGDRHPDRHAGRRVQAALVALGLALDALGKLGPCRWCPGVLVGGRGTLVIRLPVQL